MEKGRQTGGDPYVKTIFTPAVCVSSVMNEDLIGYLLGALEPHEMKRVEAWLREDPAAREQIHTAERLLLPLETSRRPIDTEKVPDDLIKRTLAGLPPTDEPWPENNETDWSAPKAVDSSFDSQAIQRSENFISLSPQLDSKRGHSLSWFDLAGLSAAAAVVLALLVPAIAQGRSESRRVACQDQLRQMGMAITQFAERSNHGRLPEVAQSGPEAFAGVYAVRLNDAGLLADPATRWCPSLDAPGSEQQPFHEINQLVSLDQVNQSPLNQLRNLQQFSGGHYAYTLGVRTGDDFSSPRYEGRSSFAVMADAALTGNLTETNLARSIGHGGEGVNVLYEDGRVDFMSTDAIHQVPDHPFFNHHGDMEAGVNIDDAVLAPSWRPPFVEVQQR